LTQSRLCLSLLCFKLNETGFEPMSFFLGGPQLLLENSPFLLFHLSQLSITGFKVSHVTVLLLDTPDLSPSSSVSILTSFGVVSSLIATSCSRLEIGLVIISRLNRIFVAGAPLHQLTPLLFF
jgi:hypothetical protein